MRFLLSSFPTLFVALLFALSTERAEGSLIFSEDFDTGVTGATPAGWTWVDILGAGDHPSTGLRPNGSTTGGGGAVLTRDGLDFFLGGGRSSVFAAPVVGAMQSGTRYVTTLFAAGAGSSFDVSRAYYTIGVPQDSLETVTPLSTTNTSAGGFSDWREFSFEYTATAGDAGKVLFLNLESRRDVSTAVVGWDDISVLAIPEPATSTILAIFFAALTWIRRRRWVGIR